jgi:HD-GYP domain-containing protein (c-di-GMP phosphodiesterase class II)
MGEKSTLTKRLERHDPDSLGHAERVTALALRIAEALRAGAERVDAIRAGGPVHDIGKLGVAAEILRKPGALAPNELAEIRTHPVRGARMLERAAAFQRGLACVLHHHERWDGTGYPDGLAGDEIPIEARILAVADAYDAMTSDRPYRAALRHEEAVAEVERCSGSQFDPRVARAFCREVSDTLEGV